MVYRTHEPAWSRRWGYSSNNPMPIWLVRWINRIRGYHRQVQIRRNCEAMIDAARAEHGLVPLSAHREIGRPSLTGLTYLTMSRERFPHEFLDSVTHKADHKGVHVIGCAQCWKRKYSYLKRHGGGGKMPWWMAENFRTNSADGKPRAMIDPGWEKHHAPAKHGELARTLMWIQGQDRKGTP